MRAEELSKPLGNSPPRPRLPELSSMVISKNVWYEIERLKAAPAWQQAAGRSSETLAKYPGFSIILLLMKAGSQMGRHHAEGRISVYVIEGRIRLSLAGGKPADLGAGDMLTLDQGVDHQLEAVQESAFLLTVAGT